MAGFIVWIGERWAEFRKICGCRGDNAMCNLIHAEQFDRWLEEAT